MALRKVFETFDIMEPLLGPLDEWSIVAAIYANTALRETVENSLPLLRRLFLLKETNEPKIWRYYPNGRLSRVYNKFRDSDFQTYFTIWTPHPLLLTRTPQRSSSLRQTLAFRHGGLAPYGWNPLDNPVRYWNGTAQNGVIKNDIDRLNLVTGILGADLEHGSVLGAMFLFREYAPVVTVAFRAPHFPQVTMAVTNAEGVRLRDVVELLKYECPPRCRGNLEVQIWIDGRGAIFPTEQQVVEVEAGLRDVAVVQK